MSDDIKPEAGAIPPRVTIKIPGQSGDISGSGDAAGKKKTARLSLDQVTADPGAVAGAHVEGVGGVSKTIRLSPAQTGQATVTPLPSVGKALAGTFAYDEAKRQTSRIPLEAVMPGASGTASLPGIPGVASTMPKTIKVKRPSLSLSADISAIKAETPAAIPVEAPAAGKNQTARVDLAPEAVTEGVPDSQPTQKKTIKIRRADGAESKPGEVRSVSIARADGTGAGGAVVQAVGQVAKPHGAYVGLAAVALLVLCFMIYLLAAQAYPSLGWSV